MIILVYRKGVEIMEISIKYIPQGLLLNNLIRQIDTGYKLQLIDTNIEPVISLQKRKNSNSTDYYFQISLMEKNSNQIVEIKMPLYSSRNVQRDTDDQACQYYQNILKGEQGIIGSVYQIFMNYGIKKLCIRENMKSQELPVYVQVRPLR